MRPIDADELQQRIGTLAFKCRTMLWSGGELYVECLRVVQKMISDTPTITPPPNDPLTLEQLREMDGEPVWICDPDGSDGMWALVDLKNELCRTAKGGIAIFDTYGKTWLAYRRKPEEDNEPWKDFLIARFEQVEVST